MFYISEIWISQFGLTATLFNSKKIFNSNIFLELNRILYKHVFCYFKDFKSLKALLINDNINNKFALEVYFINMLFNEDSKIDFLNLANKNLNIQWAIDIKNQINK